MSEIVSRRTMLAGAGSLAPALLLQRPALAMAQAMTATPPSVISNPPREWGPGAPPTPFPDPDIVILEPSFRGLLIGLSGIKRIKTGFEWAEGPAWCAQGNYALFSDVKGSIQYRMIWETGEITPFRSPSYNSNGNAFDFEGRQISTQDFFRRVIRWEHDGSMRVLADSFEGKPLNSPNDLAAHPDGSVWFTDPPFGESLSEGHPDVSGGASNPNGVFDPALGNGGVTIASGERRMLPANVYRWDPSGRLDVVVPEEKGLAPNGLAFSPDAKILYMVRGSRIYAADVAGAKLSNMRLFSDCMIDGIFCRSDGLRADRAGNVWSGSSAVLGYCGVTVWNPAGKAIGRIRLPEICANLCFAGPKRDWLFMPASQSVYMLRVNVQGSSPG